MYTHFPSIGWNIEDQPIRVWNLVPASQARVFPDYVPEAIREDYTEACLIRELSAKSAATLARRCLQGMIRDYWKISKSNLKAAIDELKVNVDPLTWQAIEGVRTVGNIGAHMEKDIELIVEVEPEEAELLIGLIEILVEDWYIARNNREERLKGIADMAQAKQEERKE